MYQNSFGVSVEGGRERESGYVEMRHGSTYKLRLRNDRSVPCDATVEIDGKDIGTFRITAKSSVLIERPSNEAKRFTFFKADTREARKSGQSDISFDERGLVRVTFRPGMESKPVAIVTEDRGWDKQFEGFDVPTNLSRHAGYGVNMNASASDSENMSEALKGIFRDKESDEATWELEDSAADRSLGMKVESFAASRRYSPLRSHELPKKGRRSGMTGMTGHSNQRFSNTSALTEYDTEHETEINLRLVAVEDEREDPTPLRPVSKRTPVPPAIYLF